MFFEYAGSDVLYHVTTLKSLEGIAKTNEFQLKPSDGNSAEEKFGAKFYLSTARSKLSSYVRDKSNGYYALIELDGRKLGQRYTVIPVDYWETNNSQNAEERILKRKNNYEMEDRVLSRTPKIPNAKSYIKSIHCAYNQTAHMSPAAAYLVVVFKWCRLNKIPLFTYQNADDALRMDTRKAIHFDPVRVLKNFYASEDFEDYTSHNQYLERRNKLAMQHEFRSSSLMSYWILYITPLTDRSRRDEILNRIDRQKPKLKIKDRVRNLGYSDAYFGVEADFHNAKRVEYGTPQQTRETLDKLVVVLRKHRWSIKDFTKFLRDKWY